MANADNNPDQRMEVGYRAPAAKPPRQLQTFYSMDGYTQLPLIHFDGNLRQQAFFLHALAQEAEDKLQKQIIEGCHLLECVEMSEEQFQSDYGKDFADYTYATSEFKCIVPGTQMTALYLEFIRMYLAIILRQSALKAMREAKAAVRVQPSDTESKNNEERRNTDPRLLMDSESIGSSVDASSSASGSSGSSKSAPLHMEPQLQSNEERENTNPRPLMDSESIGSPVDASCSSASGLSGSAKPTPLHTEPQLQSNEERENTNPRLLMDSESIGSFVSATSSASASSGSARPLPLHLEPQLLKLTIPFFWRDERAIVSRLIYFSERLSNQDAATVEFWERLQTLIRALESQYASANESVVRASADTSEDSRSVSNQSVKGATGGVQDLSGKTFSCESSQVQSKESLHGIANLPKDETPAVVEDVIGKMIEKQLESYEEEEMEYYEEEDSEDYEDDEVEEQEDELMQKRVEKGQ